MWHNTATMIIFLYGNNSYLRYQRLQTLQEAFKQKFDTAGFSVASISGQSFDINEFRKLTRSAGLFSEKRFVVVDTLWALSKDAQEELQEEFAGVNEDTIVCVTTDMPPRKDNALFKYLLAANTVEEYGDLDGSGLRTFIQNTAKKYNASVDNESMQLLINAHGNDLWSLHNEIHKLAYYGSQITKETVTEFADEQLDDNIFHFTDALGTKNSAEASRLLNEQLESGANAQYLLTMIGRHIGTLAKVKQTSGGKGLTTLHSFVLEKARAQAKKFTLPQLLRLQWDILRIDQTIKTTKHSPAVLLQQWIVNACSE